MQEHSSSNSDPLALQVRLEAVDAAFGIVAVTVVIVTEVGAALHAVFDKAGVARHVGTQLVLTVALSTYRDAQLHVGALALIGSPFVLLPTKESSGLFTAAHGAAGVLVVSSLSSAQLASLGGAVHHANSPSKETGNHHHKQANEPFRYGPLMDGIESNAALGGDHSAKSKATVPLPPNGGARTAVNTTTATAAKLAVPLLMDTAWYVPIELVESLHERYQEECEFLLRQQEEEAVNHDDELDTLDSQS